MSKAINFFNVVEDRKSREFSGALQQACAHITSSCVYCPLDATSKCVREALPPAGQPENDEHICKDWLTLHFIGEAKDGD